MDLSVPSPVSLRFPDSAPLLPSPPDVESSATRGRSRPPGAKARDGAPKPVPDPVRPERRPDGKPSIAALERYATILRIHCVRMLAVAKSGHLDSSLSAADIVAALYHRVLRHDPSNPKWPERDRFVLSKGHAAPIQYAALAEHGYFPADDLMACVRSALTSRATRT